MKWLIATVLCLALCVFPGLGYAGVKEDYEQGQKIFIAAGACFAAYSDRYGQLANKYLEQAGWQIDHYEKIGNSVDSRFLLATKSAGQGQPVFVLAFVGTENAKDMQANLETDKVYFAGANLDDFSGNAGKQEVPSSEPKVHRGFHEFVQAGLGVKVRDVDGDLKYVSELLLANKNKRIYLVGHSRGGAAATLAGARLVSMGVSPEQIEIITFGAPAVGNAAFAAQFGPVLNLTRVVIFGDPVTGVLQTLVGGYKQFGREVLWDDPVFNHPHDITEYTDLAIKRYYDARQQAEKSGIIPPRPDKGTSGANAGRVYIAPLKNSLRGRQTGEFPYIEQALRDEYRRVVPGYIFGDGADVDHLFKRAAQSGCKWLIVPEVSSYQMKDEQNVYYISLMQTIYDVTSRKVIKTGIFSTGTYNFTLLEAFIHACKDMNYDWLIKK